MATAHSDVNPSAATSPGSAIYVDTENLRDSENAQSIVARIIANWPAKHPDVGSVCLYVRADKGALWRLWAETTYPDLRVRVRGIQHFSNHRAKNSADLAITADAVADLITGQATLVAVVSNDSDFGALFVKVNELARGASVDQTPFLWITAPDAGGVSDEIDQFIPAQFRWDLSAVLTAPTVDVGRPEPQPLPRPARPAVLAPAPTDKKPIADNEAIAEELIRRLPLGRFKVADAQQVVQARWPKQPSVNHPAKFGQYLLNEIWPVLKRRGVQMPRTTSPRTYEITQAAKDSIARPRPQPQPSRANKTDADPTPSQLAAAVAASITDDLFSATAAQPTIKSRWPHHPAASYTAAQFGTWFARQIWPVMEQHGVTLASEKPRRYEMTPDARHRLTNMA